MKKNGFTLVELLAVIVVLALLLTFAVPNVINVISRKQEDLSAQAIKDLQDAAISYTTANIYLKSCTNNWEPENINSTSLKGCTLKIKVSEIISKGYFKDNYNYCDTTKEVLVYRYINKSDGNDINEIKAYVPDDVCTVK